jgi:hypothetical protein
LKCRYDRLREKGKLTIQEMASQLSLNVHTIRAWHKAGLLQGYLGNDREVYLFDPPGPNIPTKQMGQKLSDRCQLTEAKSIYRVYKGDAV